MLIIRWLLLTCLEVLLNRYRKQPQDELYCSDDSLDPAYRKQPSRSFEPTYENGWHSQEQKHRRREGRYWLASILLSAVVAIGAGVSAIYAYRAVKAGQAQVKAAQDQADIARSALIASDRPWVMLTEIKPASLSLDDEFGTELWVNISAKNIGHSPAQNVSVSAELLIDNFDPSPDQAMVSVCREAQSGSSIMPGQVLFPGQDHDIDGGIARGFGIEAKRIWAARAARINSTRNYNMSVGRPDRAQDWADELSKFPFYAALSLVGCINYRSSDNVALYQTSFAFDVSAKPGGGGIPLLSGKHPVTVLPSSTPEDPDIVVVHPRMMQRVMPGDQIRLEKPLYSTFAN